MGQSVAAVEIGTTLVDSADGDHMVENGTVTVVDTVEYKGLVAGGTYTAHGTIMDKNTGLPLEDSDGNPVTAFAEFVAEGSEGTVEVAFEFDASQLGESTALVAFEEVLDASGNVIAAHQDLEDEGQTVVVDNPETPETPESPYAKTGADAPRVSPIAAGAVALAAVAAAAGASYAIRSRSRISYPDRPQVSNHHVQPLMAEGARHGQHGLTVITGRHVAPALVCMRIWVSNAVIHPCREIGSIRVDRRAARNIIHHALRIALSGFLRPHVWFIV